MKAGLLTVAALAANAAALALPVNVKREVATETFTQYETVYATAAAVYVTVDQYGNAIPSQPSPAAQPVDVNINQPVAAPAPAVTPAAPAPVVPAVNSPAAIVPAISIPAVVIPPVIPAASPAAQPANNNAAGLGITYSPYTSGPCKNADQVKQDLAGFSDYSFVRIYGTDCNQVANVLAALNQGSTSQKLLLGIYNIDSVSSEVESVKSQVAGRWNLIDTISVGNEHVANGRSVSDVAGAVSSARSQLNAAGYTGKVVTVDTVQSYLSNPGLCSAGDDGAHANAPVYANCHPFFDPNTSANNAGSFIQGQIDQIKSKCPGREVIITETGWPSGSLLSMTNGLAIPSLGNQQTALASIKKSFASNLYLFSAYNEQWKPINAATFGVEQSWGVLGNSKFN